MRHILINKTVILAVCTLSLSACSYIPGKNDAADAAYKVTSSKAPQNYSSAIAAAKNGKTSKAIKLLTEITNKNPDFAPAYTNLGLQYLQNKKNSQAEDAFKKAVKLNPADAIAYNHLGIIMRMKGDFSDARNMYQQALNSNLNYANAHLNLGILLDMYLYELSDALIHYKHYQSLTNNNDKLVGKWIIDIKRRIQTDTKI